MVINEKTIEALIVRFIPTSQYFEKLFDHLEDKLVYKFEVLNEKMDQRFQQVDAKLDKIIESIDKRIDEGPRENRSQSFRLFTFAMTFSTISMVGMPGRHLQRILSRSGVLPRRR